MNYTLYMAALLPQVAHFPDALALLCITFHTLYHHDLINKLAPMPPYCLQDCHYFYRTALRLLSIPTCLASHYA